MITNNGRRTIANIDVLTDDTDPLTVYVVPRPRIAVDDDGKPILSMVWYRRPLEGMTEEERRTRLGGGILTLATELKMTAAEERAVREALGADPALHARLTSEPAGGPDLRDWWTNRIRRSSHELAAAIKIAPPTIKEGTVSISILAETGTGAPTDEFVSGVIGAGRVSMTGNNRAAFMAKLTQQGAVMLWKMLESNLAAVRISYDLVYNYRLNGVTMTFWADARKVLNATQTQWASIRDDASWSVKHSNGGTHYTFMHDESRRATDVLVTIATEAKASGVVVTPDAGPDSVTPEQIAELTRSGNDMVGDFLANALLEYKATPITRADAPSLDTALATQDDKEYGHHGIEHYNLKSQVDDVHVTLAGSVSTKAVLEGHLNPNENLVDIVHGLPLSAFRTQIDIDPDWYQFLDVQVLCTADFDNDPVDLVKVRLRYKATDRDRRVDESSDFVFSKDDRGPKTFVSYLAAPQHVEYDYSYEVFYKGGSRTARRSGQTSDGILVLDTDSLGVLSVSITAGAINWDQVASVGVDLSYGTGSAAKRKKVSLTESAQTAEWKEVIGGGEVGEYQYVLTIVDKGGQRIKSPPERTSTRTLVIDQPIEDVLEVTIIPAGTFGSDGFISKIVVALRYTDRAHSISATDTYVMASDTDVQTWRVPLADKNSRTYEYRTSVFYADGVTRQDDWQTSDKPILPVGDEFGFRVQISPILLKIAARYATAIIDLTFTDRETKISAEKTLQIEDFDANLFWRFRLGAPERHTYRYRLTLYGHDGEELLLPEAEASSEVLVLKPPTS